MTNASPPASPAAALYGSPPADLADAPPGAAQVSPLRPGSADIAALADDSIGQFTVAAPPGSIERRFVLAHALRALASDGRLVALALKDKGGSRLRGELEELGCEVAESYKARHRICVARKPAGGEAAISAAIEAGSPRFVEILGLHSQPGIFSWDRIDPGSALLLAHLPALAGQGADLGAGLGILARHLLQGSKVEAVTLVELDRRAMEAARLNVTDPRARFLWADARETGLTELDFVVSNPPFHAEGIEDRGLGQAFIAAAARMLRRSGTLVLVANRHMPYEAALRTAFRSVETIADTAGYKIFEARK
ncbi:class I SAM-dependent methyltransferase [Aureimonas pseudogalii]|uniref:16S rRNA (Guanine1207-N2)-methyltransferase n=1 Tax=Aureimonas pseudogalii TaxID=1744844 RepID=A0A7W6E919_9HYPH|nr:methyltransferase [Aureimonas pseudogalii]MBB3996504.1 16S rRNA (guanine1207-N2)-methyltransferase [Aureimonas pseudogalii]